VTITDAERRRLEALEASVVSLRQAIAAAISQGLDGQRVELESRIGLVQAGLTFMSEQGDIEPANCLKHAKEWYAAIGLRANFRREVRYDDA